MLSGRGLYVGLMTRPEESNWVWCVKWVWSWSSIRESHEAELGRSARASGGGGWGHGRELIYQSPHYYAIFCIPLYCFLFVRYKYFSQYAFVIWSSKLYKGLKFYAFIFFRNIFEIRGKNYITYRTRCLGSWSIDWLIEWFTDWLIDSLIGLTDGCENLQTQVSVFKLHSTIIR